MPTDTHPNQNTFAHPTQRFFLLAQACFARMDLKARPLLQNGERSNCEISAKNWLHADGILRRCVQRMFSNRSWSSRNGNSWLDLLSVSGKARGNEKPARVIW